MEALLISRAKERNSKVFEHVAAGVGEKNRKILFVFLLLDVKMRRQHLCSLFFILCFFIEGQSKVSVLFFQPTMNKQPHEDNSTHGSDYIDHATSSVYDHNAEEGITHDADGSGSNVEDWDLTSPLLLRADQFGADQNQDDFQQFEHDKQQVQEEYGHIYTETGTEPQSEDQDEGVTTPTVPAASVYEYYRTTLAATFTMTFVILVAGSYFFEWSDTILRVQVETAIATKDDMDESYDIQQGKSLSVDLVSMIIVRDVDMIL